MTKRIHSHLSPTLLFAFCYRMHVFNSDDIRQPPIQGFLDCGFQGVNRFWRVGHEYKLLQAHTKVWLVDVFTGADNRTFSISPRMYASSSSIRFNLKYMSVRQVEGTLWSACFNWLSCGVRLVPHNLCDLNDPHWFFRIVLEAFVK